MYHCLICYFKVGLRANHRLYTVFSDKAGLAINRPCKSHARKQGWAWPCGQEVNSPKNNYKYKQCDTSPVRMVT